jgi:hypothetical protein
MLDCILNGEYTLVGLSFDGRSGPLIDDPRAYPFGGTSPLKALVTTFGFEVTRESCHDGCAEWVNREIEKAMHVEGERRRDPGRTSDALRPEPHSFFARHHAIAAAPAGELFRWLQRLVVK